MRHLICWSVLMAAGLAPGIATGAAVLPALRGELSGTVALKLLGDAPPVAWRMQAVPGAAGGNRIALTASAPGLVLRAEALAPAGGEPGTWQVVEGSVDAATWCRLALSASGAAVPPDLEITGGMQITGSGTWDGAGAFSGRLATALHGGTARSVAQGWEVGGIAIESTVALDNSVAMIEVARVSADSVQAAGVMARALVVEAGGRIGGDIEVRRGSVDVFGGRVAFSSFSFNPAAPVVRTTVEVASVALGEIAALLPETLAEARGRLNGKLEVRWSEAKGFEPGQGALTILPEEPASLRLAAAPGFLTQHMPEKIQWLPDFFGPVAHWLAPENPAYGSLRHIEMGDQSLTVETLRVELYPDGVDGLRSATVAVTARPPAGSVVEQVSFTINVAGPLQQVLQLGLDDRTRINLNLGLNK